MASYKNKNMKDYTSNINDYINRLSAALANLSRSDINNFINIIEDARRDGKRIFTMGNGGSASTASHFVCDFNKGVSYGVDSKKRYKFICLNDSIATLSAYANDVSYEDAFLESLKNHFENGDVVIAISGSGNSKNVLKAIEYANANGGITIGITGYNGGKLKQIAKHNVHADIDDMQITEDIHMILDHLSMSVVRDTQ